MTLRSLAEIGATMRPANAASCMGYSSCDGEITRAIVTANARFGSGPGIARISSMESGLDLAVEAGTPDQRLVSQFSSEGSSFQGTALFAPDGAHSAMASAFIRIVISA